MDRKSKILLYIVFFLFIGTVMFSYARYMAFRDFEVLYSEPEDSDTIVDDPMIEEDITSHDEDMSTGVIDRE